MAVTEFIIYHRREMPMKKYTVASIKQEKSRADRCSGSSEGDHSGWPRKTRPSVFRFPFIGEEEFRQIEI